MRNKSRMMNRRDVLAATAVIAIGLFGIVESLGYRLGELRNIGPGAFPLIVSGMIVLSGLIIAAESLLPAKDTEREATSGEHTRWRVLIFITAGLLSFVAITPLFGAIPAIMICVVLSAFGDGSLRLWQVLLLAAAVAAFCAIVFVLLLNLPLELVTW